MQWYPLTFAIATLPQISVHPRAAENFHPWMNLTGTVRNRTVSGLIEGGCIHGRVALRVTPIFTSTLTRQ
jgi:hypothetical protein